MPQRNRDNRSSPDGEARRPRTALIVGLCLAVSGVLWGCPTDIEPPPPPPVKKLQCGRLSAPNEANTQCQPLAAPNVSEREVEFLSLASPGGQTTLRGTLSLPEWGAAPNLGKKAPGVVLVGHAGPVSRDGLIVADVTGDYRAPVAFLTDLADGLSRRGYAVLRYDKRNCTPQENPTCTSPPEIAKKTTFDDLVGDMIAAANFLAGQPEVEPRDIILVGFEQGGTVILNGAPKVDGLTEIVLIGTNYEAIDRVMVRQLTWRIETYKDSLPAAEMEDTKKRLSEVESGFLAIKEGYMPKGTRFLGASQDFWQSWMAASGRTEAALNDVRKPILYVRGAGDQDVTQDEAELFAAAIGGGNVMNIPNHNHALIETGKEGTVGPKAITAIADWLGRKSDGGGPQIERLE